MSLRKFIRHSDGNCEKGIGFLDENESRYSSKFHNSVIHDSGSQGKWSGTKSTTANNFNSPTNQKGDRTNHMASKSFSKDAYINEAQKGKSFSRASPSRHNASSGSMFDSSKTLSRSSTDDFEWSQHVSSSGKVYYYNKKSERSQWEKPREWIEREQQRNKERYSSYKEGSRESRDSARYSRSSSRRDGAKETSLYNKRERDMSDRDRHSKVVKTEGASTSAASTVANRSSVGSTPESGSPSCSSSGLQDISPPTTPTHVNMVSPYINASTPVNVLSPHLYSCSPVNLQTSSATLMNQSSPCTNSYALVQNRLNSSGTTIASSLSRQNSISSNSSGIMLSSSSTLSPGTTPSPASLRCSSAVHVSVSAEFQQSPLLLNSNCTEPAQERISPTPPLHPLQQATLLQKQQMAGGLLGHKLTGVLHSLGPGYLSHVGQCENSPPPPPPPHGVLKKQPSRQDNYEHASRNPDLRTNAVASRSSPLPHKHALPISEPLPNSKKYSRSLEPLVFPELKDIQGFSSLCSKGIYEDVAGWYGNVLDRQANGCWEEAMHSLTQEGCRTKANWILGNFVYDILDTRVEVIDRKLACLREVHHQVESLQDLRSGS